MGARRSVARLAGALGAPLLPLLLAARPVLRVGLGERLGGLPIQVPGAVWLHGASVGEARLVARLARALETRGYRTYSTVQTPGGQDVLSRARPAGSIGYAPLDHPLCVERALDRVSPSLIVLVETEVWPFWIAGASARRVPVAVLSGRISDRSFPRYRRFAPFLGRPFARLARVGARSEIDAERFATLGVAEERLEVMGDLKRAASRETGETAEDLRRALADRPVLIAGSTHPGEEDIVLKAFACCRSAAPEAVLVLAPRHVERAESLERLVSASGARILRRTRLGQQRLAPGAVLLLDTLGELGGLYSLARSAFIGGTLTEPGGHDPFEAVDQGCPVVVGPNHHAIGDAIAELAALGVAECVANHTELAKVWGRALRDETVRHVASAQALALRSEGEAVLARAIAIIERLLDDAPALPPHAEAAP